MTNRAVDLGLELGPRELDRFSNDTLVVVIAVIDIKGKVGRNEGLRPPPPKRPMLR